MELLDDLIKEKKSLLFLFADAVTEHKPLDEQHELGEDETCELCLLFRQLQQTDALLDEEITLLKTDLSYIEEFNELRVVLGRMPQQAEYKNTYAVVKRFRRWNSFLKKADNEFKNS